MKRPMRRNSDRSSTSSRASPQFSILASLIDEADAADTLSGSGPFTLFAPSDEAFDELPPDTLAAIRQDPQQLATLLQHHVVAGSYPSSELEPGPLEMLDGTTLSVRVSDAEITIGGAAITEPDLEAGNGVVHVIDRVLVPRAVPTEPDDRAPTVSATLVAGQVVLEGEVADETQRAILLDGASRALDPANVDDQLTIAIGRGDRRRHGALAGRAGGRDAAEPREWREWLRRNRAVHRSACSPTTTGVRRSSRWRTSWRPRSSSHRARRHRTPTPERSRTSSTRSSWPTRSSSRRRALTCHPGALAVLDRIAGIAEQFDGVTITIEGHTDSDGVATENQVLSEERAAAVLVSLVARGVPVADLTAVGLGSTQPIVSRWRRGQGRQPPHRVPGDRGTRSLNGKDDMPYTLVKGLVWVVLALLIGVVIGWLLRSLRSRRQIAKARAAAAAGDRRIPLGKAQRRDRAGAVADPSRRARTDRRRT